MDATSIKPVVVSSLSLESYMELHKALTKHADSHEVVQLSNLEAAWFKMKDLMQVLALHGRPAGDRKKKETLDSMVGMSLYAPLPDWSGAAEASTALTKQVTERNANGHSQQQGQGQGQVHSSDGACAALPQPPTKVDRPAAARPGTAHKAPGQQQGKPSKGSQGPQLKQVRITAFCPSRTPPPAPEEHSIDAVSVDDLVALGWAVPSEALRAALRQPAIVLQRSRAPAVGSTDVVPVDVSRAAGAGQGTAADALIAKPAAPAVGSMQQGGGQAVAAAPHSSLPCDQLPSIMQQARVMASQPIDHIMQPEVAEMKAAVSAAPVPQQPQVQQVVKVQQLVPPAAHQAPTTQQQAVLPHTAPTHSVSTQHGASAKAVVNEPSQQVASVPSAHAQTTAQVSSAAESQGLRWLASHVVAFSQDAGVVVSSDALSAPAQLIGRRVGFLITQPLEHRDGSGRVEGVLQPGIHQGAVIRRIGASCKPEFCEAGCCGSHEWCAVRVLTPLRDARARLELTLDLAERHRCMDMTSLLLLEGQPGRLEDAWVLLKVRNAFVSEEEEDDKNSVMRSVKQLQRGGGGGGGGSAATRRRGVKRAFSGG